MQKQLTRSFAAIILWGAMSTFASSQTGLLQEEADCEGDAFRFCSQYIPDHDKIHACLYEYRAQISPACRSIIVPTKDR